MSRDERRELTLAEALAEVGLTARGETVAVPLLTDDERESILRALNDFGTTERLAALDTLEDLIERAERDSMLLNGRDHDTQRFNEAIGLIALLRAKEQQRCAPTAPRQTEEPG